MSIEGKLEKAAELEALAAKLRAEVEAETPKRWEPKPSHYFIDYDGDVIGNDYNLVGSHATDFGTGRSAREQATKDALRMRQFNRLLCWMVENGWDSGIEVYKDNGGDVCICFNESDYLGSELMRGIANGVIEL